MPHHVLTIFSCWNFFLAMITCYLYFLLACIKQCAHLFIITLWYQCFWDTQYICITLTLLRYDLCTPCVMDYQTHTHTHTQFQFLKISFFVGTRNKRGRVFRPCGHVRVFSHSFRLLRTSFMLITSLVAQTNTPTFWKEYLLNTWSLFHFTES